MSACIHCPIIYWVVIQMFAHAPLINLNSLCRLVFTDGITSTHLAATINQLTSSSHRSILTGVSFYNFFAILFVLNQLEKLEAAKAASQVCLSLLGLT